MSFLEQLNIAQRNAVEHNKGPLMVIAGPGSGKTRVLTYRIAYLISQGVDPFNILALTFTNKASKEMRERIENQVGSEARNLWMGTFHSIFARILRVEANRLGYAANFTIYDTQDSRNLIKNILKESGLDASIYKPSVVHNRISAAKNSLITANEYAQMPELLLEDKTNGRKALSDIYFEYTKRCFKANAMDFDDLLLKMYELLMRFPDVLYKYQNRFLYILIDEFQDTNKAQYLIVKMLSDVHQNICVVGDDAQSIYAFRGAVIENMLNLKKDFSDLITYRLEQNYRSTKHIVAVANHLIKKNKIQLEKSLWTENEAGAKVKILKTSSDNDEARTIADAIMEEKLRNHYRNDDFCILYRTNAQSRAFEEGLRKVNIPYQVYGGIAFYQRKEIKDILAYLKIIVNPDDEESLRRIINYPARGIGKTTLEKITVLAHEQDASLWDIISEIEQYHFAPRATKLISEFVIMIKSFQALMHQKDAYDLALHVAKSVGLNRTLKNDSTPEGISRYENFQELMNSIKSFTQESSTDDDGNLIPDLDFSLGAYLQQVTLLSNIDQDDKVDSVKLMTLHSAKGLEFPVVFIAGLEENLFPSIMSVNSRSELEEERRLFYVGVTRAEKKLVISYATTRYRFGNLTYCEPSRFLNEMPSDSIDNPQQDNQRNESFTKHKTFIKNQISSSHSLNKRYQHQVSDQFIAANPSLLQIGMKVEHQRFGFGKIVGIEGQSGKRIANIFFQEVGTKRIMLKFAKLQIVNNKTIE